jgi:CheY-like chemotaxis protein
MPGSFPYSSPLFGPPWGDDERDPPTTRSQPQGPGRVLIIDDEADVRELFRDILQGAGFEAVAAESGAAGLEILQSDPRIRVVLLDLLMPEMDGWRFRHHQLSQPRYAAIPTVIVTGAPLGGAAHEQLQAADYLSKPVTRERLIGTVAKYCDPGSASGTPAR